MKNDSNVISARLDHLNFYSPDPAVLADFYSTTLSMQSSRAGAFHVCSGPSRRILFSEGPANTAGFAAFRFESAETFDHFQLSLAKKSVDIIDSPSPVFAKDAIGVVDPDGNTCVFGHAKSPEFEPASPESADTLQARLQHYAIATDQPQRLLDFYNHKLGFTISDNVVDEDNELRAIFLRSDEEHHTVAIFLADRKRPDHHSYEVGEWNLIRDWSDHMTQQNVKLQWGPGRHGPGHNLFVMVHDPDKNWIELSAELDVIAECQPAGVWPHTEDTLNSWGHAVLRS